ncbi:membrane protein of unknown function [Vibrio tapetis subsp. tapetis]|uniref:UPF0056 membrane protein n=1 Tax=Vibrio tapetis subsp. tapetis TaxID=1671868 RepID=A0A2N8ZHH8_9VIBR|nr:membrane protein of unknown function [Vibrio tapetis subsp. tapetis]
MEIISAAVMLFLIMDPLGNLPVLLSILKHLEPKRRRFVLVRELIFALIILMLFLFAGQSILNFLHVQPETLSISGGIILFITAITLVNITFTIEEYSGFCFLSSFRGKKNVTHNIYA